MGNPIPFPGRCASCGDRLKAGERSFCRVCEEYWVPVLPNTAPAPAGARSGDDGED